MIAFGPAAHCAAPLKGNTRATTRGSTLLLAAMALLCSCAPAAVQEGTFRIRSQLGAPLNADTGWAGAPGEAVTVEADHPFRLRMEIAPQADGGSYALQARRNDGAWETLEAQDFPYPKRELELDFAALPPGAPPPGWTLRAGSADDLAIVDDPAGRLLRASGGGDGLYALYPAPWPLPEFSLAARFRLPAEGSESFAMLFGYVDAANHGLVRFDPERGVAILRVADGAETLLAEQAAPITRGEWHEAEIQLEGARIVLSLDDDALELAAPLRGMKSGEPGLAVPPGGEVELAGLTIEGVARTPLVSIVATAAYTNGAPTTDLLEGSAAPFTPAFGLSLAERTPAWAGANRHGEFEWPLVIRRFGDGPQLNEAGDRFAFRMVDAADRVVPGGAVANVTLAIPPGHLGGTYVENPGRIGPWQAANGDLYFIMEPTETDNDFMMMKSSDGGRSWREVDAANRPQTNDLESVDSRQLGDRIHIIHQVTEGVHYHVFRTSDHPTHPDSWELRDEVAAQAEAIAQTATMAIRSDGSIAAIFLADRMHYAIRALDGTWSTPVEIDPDAASINAGPQAVAGRDDVIHLAYFSDDGRIWYRRLMPDGTLTAAQLLAEGAGTSRAEYGAVLPLAYDLRSDTVIIVYRLADGTLWERRVSNSGEPTPAVLVSPQRVITDAVDSQQPAADVVVDGEAAHVLFVAEDSRGIFSTREDGGRWRTPVLKVDGIEGSWVRGNVLERPDGSRVYGYVYDAGSEGGSGLNRYAELPLDAD